MNWAEFWITILDGMAMEQFLAYVAIMALGAFVNFIMDVRHSIKRDRDTSKKFDFWFMIYDNIFRGIIGAVFVCVLVLYFEDWFDAVLNGKMAFVMGMGLDTIIGRIVGEGKSSSVLKKGREKLMEKFK